MPNEVQKYITVAEYITDVNNGINSTPNQQLQLHQQHILEASAPVSHHLRQPPLVIIAWAAGWGWGCCVAVTAYIDVALRGAAGKDMMGGWVTVGAG